jgi:NtrC-family two-component system response regulator AlgB
VVVATNRDLEAAIAAGAFREDLFYRLNVVELTLPPLRERSDRLEIAARLLAFFSRQSGRKFDGFTREAEQAIDRHTWPGNLRELRNTIERAAILAEGPEIGLADLPDRVARAAAGPQSTTTELGDPVSLEKLEAEHIRRVVSSSTSLDAAAKTLGIDPSTLYRKRKQYGI